MPSRLLTLLLLAALMLTGVAGCGEPESDTIELTGVIAAPTIELAVPDIAPPRSSATASGSRRSAAETPTASSSDDRASNAPATQRPTVTSWARVTSVTVNVGDHVARGDVVVEFDSALLQAGLAQSQAAEKSARATASLLGVRLDEASKGVQDVEKQRSELATTLVEFEKRRADVQLQLDAARQRMGSRPVTGTPDATATAQQLAKTLGEIDLGIRQTQEALLKLNESGAQVETMLSGLEGAKLAAEAFVQAAQAGVTVATARVELASLIAPTAGVVTRLPGVGDVIAAGAPIATIRPEGATEVLTYVTAREREMITLGSSARITSDSLPGDVLAGAVTEIGIDYEPVPSYFATDEIHLTRAFEVTIVVYGDTPPPPGTPVDVSIDTLASGL